MDTVGESQFIATRNTPGLPGILPGSREFKLTDEDLRFLTQKTSEKPTLKSSSHHFMPKYNQAKKDEPSKKSKDDHK